MHNESNLIDTYPSWISLTVQWGDMDALGHVNNTVPIRWFESSRIAYIENSGIAAILEQLGLGPILAAVNCSYRQQLFYPDTAKISCRVDQLGRSSLTLKHLVISERSGEVAAQGESVVVVFNFQSQKPVRIPEQVRANVCRLQPELANR